MDHLNLSPPDSQLELWSHFQNERTAVFDLSKGRLDALIGYAKRWASGRSLLNVGCGNGYLERTAKQKGWNVISVDPDRKSVARLASSGIDARCGFIQALPLAAETVDVAICSEVLEHIPCEFLDAGISELHRVLVPKGILIGTVPYRENLIENEVCCPACQHLFHRWGHQQSFDEVKVRSILTPRFSIRVLRQAYFPSWNAPSWKTRLAAAARLIFSWVGIYGSNTNLLFIAVKNCP